MPYKKLVIHKKYLPERTAGELAYQIGTQLNELLSQPKTIEASAQFDAEIDGQRFLVRVDRISFESPDGEKYLLWPAKDRSSLHGGGGTMSDAPRFDEPRMTQGSELIGTQVKIIAGPYAGSLAKVVSYVAAKNLYGLADESKELVWFQRSEFVIGHRSPDPSGLPEKPPEDDPPIGAVVRMVSGDPLYRGCDGEFLGYGDSGRSDAYVRILRKRDRDFVIKCYPTDFVVRELPQVQPTPRTFRLKDGDTINIIGGRWGGETGTIVRLISALGMCIVTLSDGSEIGVEFAKVAPAGTLEAPDDLVIFSRRLTTEEVDALLSVSKGNVEVTIRRLPNRARGLPNE